MSLLGVPSARTYSGCPEARRRRVARSSAHRVIYRERIYRISHIYRISQVQAQPRSEIKRQILKLGRVIPLLTCQ